MTLAEPIKLTYVSEKVANTIPDRLGYTKITEKFFVDQYGHEWHSFHSEYVFEAPDARVAPLELEPDDRSNEADPD